MTQVVLAGLLVTRPWLAVFAGVLGLHAIAFTYLYARTINGRFLLLALAFTCWSTYWFMRAFRLLLPHMVWIRLGGYAFAIPAIIWLLAGFRRQRDKPAVL